MEAAARGYTSVVKLLLDHGANVNGASAGGDTALHVAAQRAATMTSFAFWRPRAPTSTPRIEKG